MKAQAIRGTVSAEPGAQRDRLSMLLRERGIACLARICRAGITAGTVSRPEGEGFVTKLWRGLCQLADGAPEDNYGLPGTAKRERKSVICLVSALTFHAVNDQMPRRVWIAIGPKDWMPKIDDPPCASFGSPTSFFAMASRYTSKWRRD